MVDKPAAPDSSKDFFRNSLRESIYNQIEWVSALFSKHCSSNKIENILKECNGASCYVSVIHYIRLWLRTAGKCMPFMLNARHEQGIVKSNGPIFKYRCIFKKAGAYL